MEIIDTEKLTLFNDRLKKLSNNCEENWYLLKRTLTEIEIDEVYENEAVMQELREALSKLEEMMQVFQSLDQITASLATDYEAMANRHIVRLSQMSEYVSGLKATFETLNTEKMSQVVPVSFSYTAPIQSSLRKQYGQIEVVQDE